MQAKPFLGIKDISSTLCMLSFKTGFTPWPPPGPENDTALTKTTSSKSQISNAHAYFFSLYHRHVIARILSHDIISPISR